jgi:hypothetical protein
MMSKYTNLLVDMTLQAVVLFVCREFLVFRKTTVADPNPRYQLCEVGIKIYITTVKVCFH